MHHDSLQFGVQLVSHVTPGNLPLSMRANVDGTWLTSTTSLITLHNPFQLETHFGQMLLNETHFYYSGSRHHA